MGSVSQPDLRVTSEESQAAGNPRVVVVTGISGGGRRTAAHVLEDLGWYVVDNLPPSMFTQLLGLALEKGYRHVAVVLDVRSRESFEELPRVFASVEKMGQRIDVLYLDATDDAIVKRQESSRRPLPLQGDGPILDGVIKERRMLATLRASADMVIDTTNLNVHQLQERVAHAYGGTLADELRIAIVSFGFKNGLPIDADMVFDVRFLPNPHWVPELRPQTGLSEAVSSYVLAQSGAQTFLDEVQQLLRTVTDGYIREGKRLVTIGVGCTGGKHRSTAMAEALSARLAADGLATRTIHRDLGKE